MLAQTLPKYAYDLGASAQLIGVLAGALPGMCPDAAAGLRTIGVDNENRLLLLV